jgi:hypothetical protein
LNILFTAGVVAFAARAEHAQACERRTLAANSTGKTASDISDVRLGSVQRICEP